MTTQFLLVAVGVAAIAVGMLVRSGGSASSGPPAAAAPKPAGPDLGPLVLYGVGAVVIGVTLMFMRGHFEPAGQTPPPHEVAHAGGEAH